ncbi:MAG: hypothetical protein ACE14S_08450 [Candidatus Bathyarchaeia archaeon]
MTGWKNRITAVYGKKLFSLTLIFNSLLSIAYAIGLLAGYYAAGWGFFSPFIMDGNMFWLIIPAAIINIFPAAHIGKVHTGRLWFHHYVYGFFVSISSALAVMLFTPISLSNLFVQNITDLSINVGRFYILGGLTLILDDLPDVSKHTRSLTSWLKLKAYQGRRIVHAIQFLMGLLMLYFAAAVSLWITQHPDGLTVANSILVGTLVVTSIMSFANVKRKIWLKITPGQQ